MKKVGIVIKELLFNLLYQHFVFVSLVQASNSDHLETTPQNLSASADNIVLNHLSNENSKDSIATTSVCTYVSPKPYFEELCAVYTDPFGIWAPNYGSTSQDKFLNDNDWANGIFGEIFESEIEARHLQINTRKPSNARELGPSLNNPIHGLKPHSRSTNSSDDLKNDRGFYHPTIPHMTSSQITGPSKTLKYFNDVDILEKGDKINQNFTNTQDELYQHRSVPPALEIRESAVDSSYLDSSYLLRLQTRSLSHPIQQNYMQLDPSPQLEYITDNTTNSTICNGFQVREAQEQKYQKIPAQDIQNETNVENREQIHAISSTENIEIANFCHSLIPDLSTDNIEHILEIKFYDFIEFERNIDSKNHIDFSLDAIERQHIEERIRKINFDLSNYTSQEKIKTLFFTSFHIIDSIIRQNGAQWIFRPNIDMCQMIAKLFQKMNELEFMCCENTNVSALRIEKYSKQAFIRLIVQFFQTFTDEPQNKWFIERCLVWSILRISCPEFKTQSHIGATRYRVPELKVQTIADFFLKPVSDETEYREFLFKAEIWSIFSSFQSFFVHEFSSIKIQNSQVRYVYKFMEIIKDLLVFLSKSELERIETEIETQKQMKTNRKPVSMLQYLVRDFRKTCTRLYSEDNLEIFLENLRDVRVPTKLILDIIKIINLYNFTVLDIFCNGKSRKRKFQIDRFYVFFNNYLFKTLHSLRQLISVSRMADKLKFEMIIRMDTAIENYKNNVLRKVDINDKILFVINFLSQEIQKALGSEITDRNDHKDEQKFHYHQIEKMNFKRNLKKKDSSAGHDLRCSSEKIQLCLETFDNTCNSPLTKKYCELSEWREVIEILYGFDRVYRYIKSPAFDYNFKESIASFGLKVTTIT